MEKENLFLCGRHASFYLIGNATSGTKFLVKPNSDEEKIFLEQMNGALNLMEQHRSMQQRKKEKFIPRVDEFDSGAGRLTLTIPANLTAAVPMLAVDYANYVLDCQHAEWITKQAFQLASLAYESGIVLPFSTENFLVCYESQTFAMLDWTMAQVGTSEICPIDATVAKCQVADLANMLVGMIDYRSKFSNPSSHSFTLRRFMQEAANEAFLNATEAVKILYSLLS